MRRRARSIWRHDGGAVAPTVALSLVGLIAVGGIAFDYAHMAALDTELQQAADQAALAAATQLDGQTGAIARATAAAQALIKNKTLFAVGTTNRDVGIPVLTFCKAFDDSVESTSAACTTTTVDKDAHVVWVAVGGRAAAFALTPIVGALSSGTIGAEAVAAMNSAVCKEPPVMMCNPAADPTKFDANSYIGKGIRLVSSGSYAPGNFGWLDVGAGASDLAKLMGYGSPPDRCVDIGNPSTETGNPASVMNEFNTRFDIYESGDSINCFSLGLCPPSLNSRKDVVMNHTAPYTKQNCGLVNGAGSNGWVTSANPYRPTATPFLADGVTPDPKYVNNYTATVDAMGYPRDKCHATSLTGSCAADRVGTGDWDIDTYWRVNHPVGSPSGGDTYPTGLNATIRAAYPLPVDATRTYPTRYQVYRWEMANAATQLPAAGRPVGADKDYGQPICKPPGSAPSTTAADRRTIPIAVVNCTGLNGKKAVTPIDWVDSFLVQPSRDRDNGLNGPSKVTYTQLGDVYVEVIGHTGNGTGGSTTQFVRHDRPYLIR